MSFFEVSHGGKSMGSTGVDGFYSPHVPGPSIFPKGRLWMAGLPHLQLPREHREPLRHHRVLPVAGAGAEAARPARPAPFCGRPSKLPPQKMRIAPKNQRPRAAAPRVSMTLEKWLVIAQNYGVMTPFLRGHGDSRRAWISQPRCRHGAST